MLLSFKATIIAGLFAITWYKLVLLMLTSASGRCTTLPPAAMYSDTMSVNVWFSVTTPPDRRRLVVNSSS